MLFDFKYIGITLWGVSEAGYRAGLSRRRPRVRVPYIPTKALVKPTGAFFLLPVYANAAAKQAVVSVTPACCA